jgi:glutamate-ammonia-ligase adenylyltransferase
LSEATATAILQPYGFADCRRADGNMQAIADEPLARQHLADIVEALLDCVAESADPDQALDYLERFAKASPNKLALLSHLRDSPATLHLLATVFGSSPFLSQILIRNPEYLYTVTGPDNLERARSRRELEKDLAGTLRSLRSKERQLDALRRFKRRELLAIGVRDLLRKASVEETTAALSALAEVIIRQVYVVCRKELRRRHGLPRAGFTVLAMGKLGGGELNFSSDVDLVYLCGSDAGHTTGTKALGKTSRLSHEAYFRKLAQGLTNAMSEVTNEGYLFRVDLRLRPEGKTGKLVESLRGCRRYYGGSRGQPWERLAQIKAWPVAGDKTLGKRFLEMVRPFIYRKRRAREVFEDVRRMKGLINVKMEKRGEARRNVKLGTGGIREIEFVVQALQAAFGGALPAIRERNTVTALGKLLRARLISADEHQVLVESYWFLRDVEHKLQMVEEQQTHTLPADPVELRKVALRLGYRDSEEAMAAELFVRDHARRTERVHEVFRNIMASVARSPESPSS